MIISHQKRFVMFLPWKTASQTMTARLERFNESPYSRFFSFNRYLNRVVHQHMTCADFHSLPECALGYLTASFVRNPYDRAYSGFRQLQSDIAHQPSMLYPAEWIRTLVQSQLAENKTQIQRAANDFDTWVQLLDEGQVIEQGRNTSFPLHPAHYWTHVAGKQVVDFVGKVESFDKDFAAFCRMVDVHATPEIDANVVDLEARSALGGIGYRYSDRMNAASIRKINALFSEDFDIFGYERVDPNAIRSAPPASG